MLARLFVASGGLLVLALAAAVVVPPFVDWSNFRADFERELAAVLGRSVTVRGEAHARLLPFPSVTFTDVSVGGMNGGEPAMTVETFSMDAELAPLLSGEFRIFDMRLERPKATVALAADGTVDWAIRPSTPFDPARITLENLTITEGQVLVKHGRSGRTHRLTEINAELSARALAGPWRADGSLRVDGTKTALTLSTGTVEDGAMHLKLTAVPAGRGVSIYAEGDARLDKGAPSWGGAFRVASIEAEPALQPGGAQAQKSGRVAKPAASEPAGFRMSGNFQIDQERLEAEEFRFETGPAEDPYTATGTALLAWGGEPRFAVEASGAQIRFDEAVMGVDAPAGEGTGITLERRLAALEEALFALPRPTIPGSIKLSLPAVVAGDTTVRDLSLEAEPVPAGWRIDRLAATLPGRATLEAGGLLTVEESFGFDGSLLLAVAQPSGFAAWLSRDVDEAIRRLPGAGFSAQVSLTAESQSVRDLELDLGGATFRGSIENRTPRAGRASASLQLDGGRLDLDELTAFVSLFVSEEGQNRFTDRDLDLRLKAGPVGTGGVSAETADADLRLRGDRLEIRKLELTGMAGANVTASGALSNFSSAPEGRLSGRLSGADLSPLVRLAAARLPEVEVLRHLDRRAAAFSGLLAAASLDWTLEGASASGSSLAFRGVAGGSNLDVAIGASGDLGKPADADWSISLDAANPDGAPLLALAGLPALPLELAGPATAKLSANGSLRSGMIGQAILAGEGFSLALDGILSAGADGAAANGAARLEASDIEPWLAAVGASLPGFGLGTSVDLSAEVDWADDLLVLSNIAGSVGEDAVAGDVNVALTDGLPDITGALTLDSLDFEQAAAVVLGPNAFEVGAARLPATPFAEAPAAPFKAALDLSVGSLQIASLALDQAGFALKLDSERIALDGLTATLAGGSAGGGIEVKNSGGTGLLSAQLRLRGADLNDLLPGSGLSGKADLSATISSSGKSVGGLAAAMSGSGTAGVADFRIAGLDAGAFPKFIEAADRIGRDVDAQATARFAPAIAGAGEYSARRIDIPFTIAGGILRAPPVVVDNGTAKLAAEIRADLNTGEVTVDGGITYAAGEEALVGSEPRVDFRRDGPLFGGRLTFDSEPLSQFLTQRALEREQARVEAMQADLLEKQRLRREARYYASLEGQREQASEERRRQAEAAQARAAEREALEEAARQAEAERRRQEEAERRKAAEAQAAAQEAAPEVLETPPEQLPSVEDGSLAIDSLPGVSIDQIPADPLAGNAGADPSF